MTCRNDTDAPPFLAFGRQHRQSIRVCGRMRRLAEMSMGKIALPLAMSRSAVRRVALGRGSPAALPADRRRSPGRVVHIRSSQLLSGSLSRRRRSRSGVHVWVDRGLGGGAAHGLGAPPRQAGSRPDYAEVAGTHPFLGTSVARKGCARGESGIRWPCKLSSCSDTRPRPARGTASISPAGCHRNSGPAARGNTSASRISQ
jgi:hypothetical protein